MIETFRNEIPYPFCPGCGHGSILDKLNEAMVRLDLDPSMTVIVSDIGCSGLSDQYFATSAFHGLHGRSVTYATGIKLANPELTVIVVMGDGGTGIGGAHLLGAARRNIGITVLVMNNLNFGMTGGQHSTTTPEGAVTSTTPAGNLEHPLDICGTVGVNGAGFVFRGTSFDEDLTERMAEAIAHPGFSLLDVWELCTAYFVKSNKFTRRGLEQTMSDLGMERGILYRRETREFAAAYREAHAAVAGKPPARIEPIPVEFTSRLERPFLLSAAGAAGAKVRSAARLVGEAAIRSGLWVSQRDDYPVTVKTGHSLSQVLLSPKPVPLAPAGTPDALVLLAPEGVKKVTPDLISMPERSWVYALADLARIETGAQMRVVETGSGAKRISRSGAALAVLTMVVRDLDLFPVEALRSAAETGPFSDENLAAVEAGLGL